MGMAATLPELGEWNLIGVCLLASPKSMKKK